MLSLAAKCAHLLHLGSDEWYLNAIKKEYSDPKEKCYNREDVGDYIRKVLRAYTEADFEFLGQHLPEHRTKFSQVPKWNLNILQQDFCTSLIGWI